MKKKLRIKFFILFILTINLYAQQDNIIRVFGDSLVGKKINKESIREVHGNVVMMQGAVKIICKKAIHNISRNQAELMGNVIVTQDSIKIYTDLGFYDGNTKVAFSKSGVTYFDGHVHLQAKNGYYFFDDKKAYFFENVRLNDSIAVLTTDTLIYYDNEDKAVAVGNVIVKDTSVTIYADSLIHLRNEKITFAFKNVKIIDPQNHILIYGNKLEDFDYQNYSRITGNPLLIKIDSTNANQLDTLIISSKLMESYGDSTKRLIAVDSVKIVRGEFASINNYSVYFQTEGRLYTHKRDDDKIPPVLWDEKTQFLGDTIDIFLKENKIEKMFINSNASVILKNEKYNFRYDQISGKNIILFFGDNGLEKTEVNGNVLSIYYLYEDGEPNGLVKSSAEKALIYLNDNNIEKVIYYGNPNNEYHPENLIEGREKDFIIPDFMIVNSRPKKEELLEGKYFLIEKLLEAVNGK